MTVSPTNQNSQSIVLFDGVCNFCSFWVQFIYKRDSKGIYKFASLQSDYASSLLQQYKVDRDKFDSIVLIEEDAYYTESSAVLRIFSNLQGPIRLSYYTIIIPKFIRDTVYRFIAKNRYRIFNKHNYCELPSKELQSRMIN
ncbi:thiol-disulfide oxidoreductase DCC family protein [Paenibacillus sp. KS-LC4]|uniref:thiol-disulfide oxidoreductase DCC family protein n=1 Tax=Paenibacillus sp. KS-LC4 TaxID=2979727 RepID=UPI0030D57467